MNVARQPADPAFAETGPKHQPQSDQEHPYNHQKLAEVIHPRERICLGGALAKPQSRDPANNHYAESKHATGRQSGLKFEESLKDLLRLVRVVSEI